MDIHTAELENRIGSMQAELLGLQQQLDASRGNQPAAQQVQLPGLPQQEGIISRIWRGFRAAWVAGVALVREGWRRIKSWASTAWRTTKAAATIAWEVTKVAAVVAWGATRMVARRVWERVKSFSLRVWTVVKPKYEAVVAKVKDVSAKVWATTVAVSILVFEKAIFIAAWLARKMQQTVEVTTQAVNRLAEFLGRMLAYAIVLGLWAVLQVRTVYETARETVQGELTYVPGAEQAYQQQARAAA